MYERIECRTEQEARKLWLVYGGKYLNESLVKLLDVKAVVHSTYDDCGDKDLYALYKQLDKDYKALFDKENELFNKWCDEHVKWI